LTSAHARRQTASRFSLSAKSPTRLPRIAQCRCGTYRAQRHEQRTQLSKEGIKALEARFQEQQEKVKRAQQTVDKLREEMSINNTIASAESPNSADVGRYTKEAENLRVEQTAEYFGSGPVGTL